MANYYENRIVLSAEESAVFCQRMNHPDVDAEQSRDQNLAWIAQHMGIQMTATGFIVTVSDDTSDAVTTTDIYQVGIPKEPKQFVGIIQGHTSVTKTVRNVIRWDELESLTYTYPSEPGESMLGITYQYLLGNACLVPFGEENCA